MRAPGELDGMSLEWTPTPVRPWTLRLASGKVHKGFDTYEKALAWLRRRNYVPCERPNVIHVGSSS